MGHVTLLLAALSERREADPGHGGGADHLPPVLLWFPDVVILVVQILEETADGMTYQTTELR